jgi:DNA-binding transcriptional LysR family regulator
LQHECRKPSPNSKPAWLCAYCCARSEDPTPTETGLALFDRAKRASEEVDEADNAARGAAEGLPKAVLTHQGLTLASEWMFAPELASGAVKTVMNDWTLPDMDLWAGFPTERMASVKARAFVEYGCYYRITRKRNAQRRPCLLASDQIKGDTILRYA